MMGSKGLGLVDENAINIYTDGSCLMHDQRKGGAGICFVTVDENGDERIDDKYSPAGWLSATNQQMELKACILGIEQISHVYVDIVRYQRIMVFTDSWYVKENYRQALYSWSKHKWAKSGGAPVENAELWRQLLREIKNAPLTVNIEWVKAHKNNKYNKIADNLAKDSAKRAVNPPLIKTEVARKLSTQSTNAGSVDIHGQELLIRVIERKSMPQGKTYKYRYEVIDPEDDLFGCIDFVYYDQYVKLHPKVTH